MFHTIPDLCLRKIRSVKSVANVFKTFSVYTKTKSQRFPVFVKDRPNRRKKAAFSTSVDGAPVLRNIQVLSNLRNGNAFT